MVLNDALFNHTLSVIRGKSDQREIADALEYLRDQMDEIKKKMGQVKMTAQEAKAVADQARASAAMGARFS